MQKWVKALAFGFVSILAGFAVALVLAEGILRIVWAPVVDQRQTQELGPSEIFGHALVPGAAGIHASDEYKYAFTTSPQGFRSDRIYTARLPDVYTGRVLLLGDSFVYGMGVPLEQTFATLLAAKLPAYEIVNAGVSAYGQRNELAVLDVVGPALSPDVVILFFFWNDLDDNARMTRPDYRLDNQNRIVRTDYQLPASHDPLALRNEPRPERKLSWTRRTYVYQFYKDGLATVRHRYFGRADWYATNDTPEKRQRAWELTQLYLHMIDMRAAQLGAKLFIVYMPDYALIDATKQYKNYPPENVFIQKDFDRVCKRLAVSCVDMTPAMRRAAAENGKSLYYENDRHLAAAGHQIVADELKKLLTTALQ